MRLRLMATLLSGVLAACGTGPESVAAGADVATADPGPGVTDAGVDLGAADLGTPDPGTPDPGPSPDVAADVTAQPVDTLYPKAPPLPSPVTAAPVAPPPTAKAGKFAEGVWVLPNGRVLTPAGTMLELGSYPLGLALHPNGKTLYVSNDGKKSRAIQVIDVATKALIQTVKKPTLYRFMFVTPDGKSLYASGGPAGQVYRLTIGADGTLTDDGALSPPDGAFGIGLSPDAKTLYAVRSNADLTANGPARRSLMALDATAGTTKAETVLGFTPYDLAIAPDGKWAYVTSWREGGVQRVNLETHAALTDKDTVRFGKHAQGLVLSADGKRLYASATDSDQIGVIDVATFTLLKTIPLNLALPGTDGESAPLGRDPGFLALSPDGGRLYVACALTNEVAVIDTQTLVLVGSIPVGWYPAAVAVSPDGKQLYVANSKGTGYPPWDGSLSAEGGYVGSLSFIDVPDDATLKKGRDVVLSNAVGVSGTGRVTPTEDQLAVIPKTGKSSKIEHIVYIMRENKTFDVELGDLGTVEGGGVKDVDADPKLTLFGYEVTPNLHELAREFCVLDNFYTDGDYSATGHSYATAAKAADYIEKFYSLSGKGVDISWGVGPDSTPTHGHVFRNVVAHGLTAASFGQIVGLTDEWLTTNVFQPEYPGVVFNLEVKDEERGTWLKSWLQDHPLPAFSFILLPVNHTCCGGQANHVSPKSMIADNDLGTGLVIEALSNSPYWDKTAVFIFEDDPQDGGDHIEYHRSPFVVVSPWVKRNTVNHTHHATGSMHATAERALDLTPLTELDALASPVWGCFTATKDSTPYQHKARLYPVITNTEEQQGGGQKPMSQPMREAWSRMRFDEPDEAPGLGRVLWEMYRGTPAPWPNRSLMPEPEDAE